MPKSIDHAKRRDEIALVACKVVAAHGFEQASVVRIARETGYSTGMIAHYFDSKQEIILAALRLMLRRIEARLTQREGEPDLLAVLCEALPLDTQRYMECAFWMVFVGQVSSDKRLKRINAWVHREYQRLFKLCLASCWSEWADWPPKLRDQTLASVVTFITGLTAIAVVSRSDWPAERQVEQLSLQLSFLRRHALEVSAVSGKPSKERRKAARHVVKPTETMP
jgi:TetR/AcrR family transcriptional regulator, transcriptional repressor of bet genes